LDVYNGLLLAPHLDALFDGGWITFNEESALQFSTQLSPAARSKLGLGELLMVSGLSQRHQTYLCFHRRHVFRT
jgi:hypothetical protein